jgi:hypothetical protein
MSDIGNPVETYVSLDSLRNLRHEAFVIAIKKDRKYKFLQSEPINKNSDNYYDNLRTV